jgi:hypothetical protein
MAGYSARQSTFTTGDTITAAHSNNEFNAILAAFHVSTGHKHDGSTAGDGGPISTLFSNAISMGTGADTDIALTFNANTNDGVITWMEDEDYFQFSDDLLISSTEKIQFRDTAIYINSSADGQLDLVADTEIQIAATTIDINGNVDISGSLTLGGTAITSTATELNIMDGGTSATSTTVADADRVVYNDAGTMRQVAVTDLDTYFSATSKTLTNKTLTSPVLNTGVSGTAVLDEDNMASDSATQLATQQSIKAYVDSSITAEDLDITSDSGTIAIDLDSETLTIAGGTGLTSSATSNTVTLAIDSTVATLTGSQTLTNKTLTSPVLNTGVSGTAVLDEDNLASNSATKLATQQSIKAYVDGQVSGVSSTWTLEDDDGTEVGVASGKEVKFIGSGITTNWTDTDNGTDADPYDMTFTVDAAQTGITSILATDLKIGEDNETKIDFETANEIHFYANNTEQVYLADNIFGPQSDSDVDLGTTGVRWKDAFVDTLTTTANITVGGDLTVNGTTTTVNSTTVTIDDPVFTLGGDSAPGSDDNKDRGIEFRWHNGSAAKVGFFGYDDNAAAFTFIPDATNSSEVFSGSVGNAIFNNVTGTLQTAAQTNITSVGALDGGSITSGFGTIDTGSSNITTTGLISGGSLDIDNVLINGTTIGHTDDTDLMTLSNGGLVIAGTLEATGNITGTLATAAQTNITSVGALDAGSITSNFGAINVGSSAITTSGTVTGGTLAGTLSTAAQTNVTSTGALDGGSITAGFGAIDNGTSGIRTNTFTAETSVVPDASGGADLGSTSLEWGDLYIADDKKIYLGSDQDVSIEYDEDGNNTTAVVAAGGVSFAPHGTGTGNGTELRFQELAANGANYVGFKAPDSISSNEVWVLPNADGTDGQFLKTDGSNALSWGSVASAGTTTLVADGAISNGQPVIITSAGKAAQVTGNAVRIGGVGSETVVYPTGQFNGTVNNLSSMVYDPDTDRFIFMTADTADQSQTSTSTHNPISKVLTIGADKSISQGTAQRMNANLNASQGVEGNGTAGCFSSGYYDTVVNKVYQFVYMAGHGLNEKGAYYTYGTVTGGTTNTISWEDMVRVSPDASTGPTSGDGGHHFAAGTVNGVRYGVWAHKNTSNQHANNGDGSALIGEMNTSSGSITWNDTAIIIDDSQNGRTLGMDVTFDTSAGKFLIQYTKGEETSSARDIHLVVATPSGTSSQSTLSLGTPVELINVGTFGGNGSQTFLQYDEELQRTVCFFMNGDTSRVNGCVISISGTTPTATTPSQIINEDCTEGGISATKNTELSTSSKGIYEVICKTSQNELYMINVEVTTSGVSSSNTLGARKFEIPNSSDADADHFAHHIAHGSSTSTDASCGILTTFGDGKATASDYIASWGNTGANQQSRPTAIFRQSDIAFSTNLTTENYIGIADANYSDGATATIQIAGSIDDAQSSLTIGQIYYVKPTGGLDRVQGLPKVVAGVATSASTLAIAGPPTDPQHDTRIYIGSRDFRREKDNSGNSNNATTFMIPANIPASEVVAYEIEIHNVSCNLTTDNIYVYCQPLASDGSTSVMSNTWHAVNSYVLGTSYSSTAYDFTSSTGIPCMLGGKNYGLFNNQEDSVPQIDNTTNDTSSGLYSKCIYTQSNRYASWNWDATYNGDGGTTGGLVSLDKGHASTDADASTTGYAHGFKIYAADSGGSVQSNISFTQGIVSVYAIVKSDLDRSGVSATGGNEDFGG